ncbi:MAG: DNA internalization-related competence protein ComEC/Rec2 [Syntrophaceae bacterium]|nr:DNA internalization-related competence protein ComEC/Rec2 [Deltaproteobacteria bacterium]
MLRHVGDSTPLVVVFSGLCCGILMILQDIVSFCFALLILFFLVSRARLIHAAAGVALGIVAASLAPAWISTPEGIHSIRGTVQSTQYVEGTSRMFLKNAVLDGRNVRGHAQLSVYRNMPELAAGSIVKADFKARARMGFGNRGEFDYRKFLLSRDIVLTGSVSDGNSITIIKERKPGGLKQAVNTRLSQLARPEAEVLKAMLTGDTSGITDSIQDRFNALGLSHLIAISGLNMTIIIFICYSVSYAVLRVLIPVSLRIDTPLAARLCGLIGVIAYTLFVGTNIPTLRASIMTVSCIFSLFFLRKSNVLEGLAIAGILILSLWPRSLYSASFLLSFAAVLGIIGTMQKGASVPQWVHFITIPVVATAFTVPITTNLFGFVSLIGIIVNIVVVPFFSIVIMPLSIAGLVIFPMWDTVASVLFALTMDAIGLLLSMSDAVGSLLPIPTPSIYWVYLCYAGLILSFFGTRSVMRTMVLTIISLAIVFIPAIRNHINASQGLCFDFISVGQGDSILLTEGPHAVLIDAGPSQTGFDMGRHVVAPHLTRRGITSLDLLVITHSHPDHIGGIPYILERFPVGQIWTNVREDPNPDFQEMLRIAQDKSIPIRNVCIGDSLRLGDMHMDVLNPQIRFGVKEYGMDQNMNSIVLKAGDQHMKGLFMADADMFGELMLTHLQRDISADVLKVAHHGSEKSCLDVFLEQVRPHAAVVCCGYNNRYGDPAPGPLLRLTKNSIRTYRTDTQGEIMISSFLGRIDVKSGRGHADTQ